MKLQNAVRHFLFLILLNCVLFSQVSQAFQTSKIGDEKFAQIVQKIQARLDELHNSLGFPGASVGFVLPDGRSGSAATGFADLKSKTPLKTSDRLLAGSIGKTFVAVETLLLAQEGKLNLDEKIERWLGDEKWFARLPNAKDITLRMLLNHSSGIPNHVDDKNFQKTLIKNSVRADIQYKDLIAYVLDKKALFPAGKGWSYADTNYILIGLIIEKATGKNLYDEIEERILKPLKLTQTIPSNKISLPQTANGYVGKSPVIENGKFVINPQWEWAGGGFASTAEDLARWAQSLYTGGVLQKDFLDEMLKAIKTNDGSEYGLGVEIADGRFGKTYGHDSEFPGYLSDMKYFPRYKIAVAVQTNADEMQEANRFMTTAVNDFAQIIISELVGEKLSDVEKNRLQKIAETWLDLITAGKFGESREGISAELKAKYTIENWKNVMQNFLKKSGKFKSRKIKSVIALDDETVTVDFESDFGKTPPAVETIILKLEKDGNWRVASYSIHQS